MRKVRIFVAGHRGMVGSAIVKLLTLDIVPPVACGSFQLLGWFPKELPK